MSGAGQLIILVIVAAIWLVASYAKQKQEAKERDERMRRLRQGPKSAEPPAPMSRPEADEDQAPDEQSEGSPLDEFRKFVQQKQVEARRPSQPPPPAPPVIPAARRTVIVNARPIEPLRPGVAEAMAARELRDGVPGKIKTAPVEAEHPTTTLADILSSSRSELAKALLMSEILGSPVILRHSPVPRWRT